LMKREDLNLSAFEGLPRQASFYLFAEGALGRRNGAQKLRPFLERVGQTVAKAAEALGFAKEIDRRGGALGMKDRQPLGDRIEHPRRLGLEALLKAVPFSASDARPRPLASGDDPLRIPLHFHRIPPADLGPDPQVQFLEHGSPLVGPD